MFGKIKVQGFLCFFLVRRFLITDRICLQIVGLFSISFLGFVFLIIQLDSPIIFISVESGVMSLFSFLI